MIDQEGSYRLFLYASDKADREDELWNARTGVFLAASSFLFVAMVMVLDSNLPSWLSTAIGVAGIMLCVTQYANSRATVRGRGIWEGLRYKTFDMLPREIAEVLAEVMDQRRHGWGILRPRYIHQYWLPAVISALWIGGIVAEYVKDI